MHVRGMLCVNIEENLCENFASEIRHATPVLLRETYLRHLRRTTTNREKQYKRVTQQTEIFR